MTADATDADPALSWKQAGARVDLLLRSHGTVSPSGPTKVPVESATAWPSGEQAADLSLGSARVSATVTAGPGVVRLTFRVLEGTLASACCGLRLSFDDWSRQVYTLMPAAVYEGNRLPPTGTFRAEQLEARGPDAEPIQGPGVPALKVEGGGWLEQMAGDMSVPLIGLFDRRSGRGLVLATPQRADGARSDSVIRLVETEGAASAAVEVLAAGIRQGEKRPGRPCNDQGQDLAAGDALTLTLLHDDFQADDPAALPRRVMAMRPRLSFTRIACDTPLHAREMLPFSATWAIQQRKFNEQNWVERHGYYSVGMREAPSQDWQTGWVGGCNTLYPLLADGDALTRRRTRRTLDFLVESVTPSGFLCDRFDQGQWRRNRRVFVRIQSDALYFLTKSLLLLKARGETVDPSWLRMTRGVALAFVDLWQRYGQFGQYIDPASGDLLIGGTCAGGLAPAGLLLAAELCDEPRFVEVARSAGKHYAERYTRRAFTNGGPGDITQAHDSESAFALLASYTHLYEYTGDSAWLPIAEDAAAQAATYVMPYDFAFPPDCTFGRLGMRTRGTVFANVQNKHSAPGICTLSGVSLLRLARATGNRQWLDLLADIAGAIPQFMSRRDRPIRDIRPDQAWPEMPEGWINERVNTSDWEVRGDPDAGIGVGEIFGGSTWSESAMLLTRVELPGVYVQPDRGWCIALDHIRATIDGHTLVLENPTPFDARVKLLIERDDQIAEPLGPYPLAGERGIDVPAHQTARVALDCG